MKFDWGKTMWPFQQYFSKLAILDKYKIGQGKHLQSNYSKLMVVMSL